MKALTEKWEYPYLFAWGLYYVFVLILLSNVHPLYISVTRATGIVGLQAMVYFLHLRILLPWFSEKKKAFSYAVLASLLMLLSTAALFWGEQMEESIFPEISEHPGPFRNGPKPMARFFGGFILTGLLPLILSALVRSSYLLRQRNAERLRLRNQMLEAETRALRSQINPHFLFNTLNNIYSLSQMGSEKTGEVILQLSDMLRYVTYDSNSTFVPLSEEVQYIRSYVQLQLLKDEEIDNVKVQLPEKVQGLQIAPMLLIPFVENSFKHSKFEDQEKGWIDMRFELIGEKLTLFCANSVPEGGHSKDAVGGVGMDNVKKRLELLYPGRFQLEVQEEPQSFTVILNLDLKP